MKKRAFAKINLTLDVIRQRSDGYHDMQMVMVPLELHDVISLETAAEYSFSANVKHLPDDEKNLIYRSIEEMRKSYGFTEEFKVEVQKFIPTQAGLGGGSSNAATTIAIVNELLDLNLSRTQLEEVANRVGKDVVFCLHSRSALVEESGEKVEFIENNCDFDVLLVKPHRGVSTRQAFSVLDRYESRHYPAAGMIEALAAGDYQGVLANLGNSFEESAIKNLPVIGRIKKEMARMGLDASLLCGSGSCVFGLSQNEESLNTALAYFRKKYPFVHKTKMMRNGHG